METGTFSATLPGVSAAFSGTYLGPYPTDTSNAFDGLDLVCVATVAVTRAPAAVPSTLVAAVKYDKAVPYPVPVVADGRPT